MLEQALAQATGVSQNEYSFVISQKEMEELREIAKAHYQAGSPEVQALAHDFFKSMDTDGDERVDLPEFLSFMRQEGYTHLPSANFFNELDKDGNGTLDFYEVMALYYIIKSGRPFCDWCGDFIPGVFFSCVECFKNPGNSFNLCRKCYQSTNCNHNHNGRVQFLDNYTLLETKRDPTLAQATGVSQNEPRTTFMQARSPILSNAIVPASNSTTNLYINSTPSPSYSSAIVPASTTNNWKAALKAFEIALSIGSISSTLCTIL
ncbi:hypothetical protein BUALT_Bualt14G0049600 [Buddleja alternifolia]|uniref:EF-hand domain-containing protein n=1 Tax=Buddleja alternifolia TaxID=168488 RepID=A0AAV6WHW6_9LAMI|nr:hypothetical protein BUALT_Bualt14G0049600 [Buddleja alternifolia]